MKQVLLATTALGLTTSIAMAGGIDRAQPNYGVLFESGNTVQFGFSSTAPSVKGEHPAATATALNATRDSENMANNESFYSFAIKTDLTDQLSFGFFMGQPYGANVDYTQGIYSAANPAFTTVDINGDTIPDIAVSGSQNLSARWESIGYEAVLRYKFNERISVHGGLRAVTSQAQISLPGQLVGAASGGALGADYQANSSRETDFGYIIGAAYEIPDIAARLAVTYRSEIEHEFDVDESATNTTTVLATGAQAMNTLLSQSSKTKIKMPQSWTIDFQTGIAENTLLFGSARWTEWTAWEVRTDGYEDATNGEITGFENDTWNYTLGLGRRINEKYSVFGTVGYEEAKGGDLNRLSPTDGSTSIGLGASYTFENDMVVRAGVQHAWLGGGETSDGTEFEGSTATSFGMTLGFKF
ncbi:OmpP1/FadL family transporter [Primorskyibacter sp. S187A]|uniref:OmpP1/FadL family transporter n=1 Tax=Primorskyibacter sp. S187A TaxID=3415130 RepID=UPI003C7B51F5